MCRDGTKTGVEPHPYDRRLEPETPWTGQDSSRARDSAERGGVQSSPRKSPDSATAPTPDRGPASPRNEIDEHGVGLTAKPASQQKSDRIGGTAPLPWPQVPWLPRVVPGARDSPVRWVYLGLPLPRCGSGRHQSGHPGPACPGLAVLASPTGLPPGWSMDAHLSVPPRPLPTHTSPKAGEDARFKVWVVPSKVSQVS